MFYLHLDNSFGYLCVTLTTGRPIQYIQQKSGFSKVDVYRNFVSEN